MQANHWFRCQHSGCKKKFGSAKSLGTPSDAFGALVGGLLDSRVFCLEHCLKHAHVICQNSEIFIDFEVSGVRPQSVSHSSMETD